MNTKTLSNHALSVIDQYLHFSIGNASCSVPYFNNKTVRARAALRVQNGKGSPRDIHEEIQSILIKNHIQQSSLTDETVKKLLTDNNIGIDCSGFAYYILNAESEDRGKKSLDHHLHFVNCKGLLGKIRASLRPIENCNVSTLADDANSRTVSVSEIQCGDMVTMLGVIPTNATADTLIADRDHILVVHQIEYQNFIPIRIHYTQSVAYPEDGLYGSGIRQGTIEILDVDRPILEQSWNEDGKTGNDNNIFVRAFNSKTELRRLKWF